MQLDEDRRRWCIKQQGVNDSKMWLQKSYLFFIPPSIITNEIAIWRIRLNCCIIPEHSTNQIQKDKGKTNGNFFFFFFGNSESLFLFSFFHIPFPIFTPNSLNFCANGKPSLMIQHAFWVLHGENTKEPIWSPEKVRKLQHYQKHTIRLWK